jgi:hypothetical protein
MSDIIQPEPVRLTVPGYAADAWDYPRRCADVAAALAAVRERVEEWPPEDKHGWWHERPHLIALHNAVVESRRDRP